MTYTVGYLLMDHKPRKGENTTRYMHEKEIVAKDTIECVEKAKAAGIKPCYIVCEGVMIRF